MKKDERKTKERWTKDERMMIESNTELWSDWSSSKARMY